MIPTATRGGTAQPPTLVDVRTGLNRTLGSQFEDAWLKICVRADISPDADSLDDAQFDQLLDAIADHDRLCRVIAMSWRIRRTAARKLADLGG